MAGGDAAVRRLNQAGVRLKAAGGVGVGLRRSEVLERIAEQRKRLRDLRPALKTIAVELVQPSTYAKPERMTADPMPGGRRGPGYLASQSRPRLSGTLAVVVEYSRPYAPHVSDESIKRWADRIALYALKGKLT